MRFIGITLTTCTHTAQIGTYLVPNRALSIRLCAAGGIQALSDERRPAANEPPRKPDGGSAPVGAPPHLVAPPRLFVPFGRVRRIAERRPDINSTTTVENEMIRFAIAMFLLLLFGVAVEELAGRSAGGPDASTDVVQAAQ